MSRVLVLKRGQLVQIVGMYPIEHQPGEREGKWGERKVGGEESGGRGREKSKWGVKGRVSGGGGGGGGKEKEKRRKRRERSTR